MFALRSVLPRARCGVVGAAVASCASRSLSTGASSAWKFVTPPKQEDQVLLGCVSYDPAITTIWEGMKVYLNKAGCPMDFVLFTNYEQQVAALLEGRIDIAWNGPIAHVMSQKLAGDGKVVSLGMRDVDCDFKSICLARKDANIKSVKDLEGKVVATGASDSPQAHIVPLQWLKSLGVSPKEVKAFDLDLGKHGDTALGEIEALKALAAGEAEAGLLSNMMYQRGLDGALPGLDGAALKAAVEVVSGEGPPLFDHCQFDSLLSTPAWKRDSFVKAVMAMDMSNKEHAVIMKLEGISKTWMPPREEGYRVVREAIDALE
mmetsp:Transcript_47300/g.101273  ORF Transcript_47300/g.101273 Transcript_47300/m.101273 type:complete len:318 (-) Transcript_47300:49-1002(-)|eukprot:CAMPEP_0206456226 /NCGR_PEP_ID=MMETSP0324_2-20121206/22237_1 /ASSEMBLY_ACC=CAM_ASM_000836 /TAXON_ID=2866 /ORGANISM="Crypthecodinium cohnii, Strain Seligo" /LENGTH=317 /DNA_ID=CAMNT_0053927111 /DNA_START=48 /DNA_END=1001 /DNA_ORIENTATION=-